MNKLNNYLDILFKLYLKINKGDSLLVSIDECYNEFIEIIKEKAREYEIDSLEFYFNNKEYGNNPVVNAINNKKKILFFIDKNNNCLNNNMARYLLDNEIDYDYVVAPLPFNKVLNREIYDLIGIDDSNPVVEASKEKSLLKRTSKNIKNLKLNKIYLEEVFGSNLHARVDEYYTYLPGKHIYPNYVIELLMQDSSPNGYIEMIKPFYVYDSLVEDLQLYIKNGRVVDYDCTNGYKYIKNILNKDAKPTVKAIGLLDRKEPTFEEFSQYNNFVLDRTNNSYLLITSYISDDNINLYLPIGSKTLKIGGYDQMGKWYNIYQNYRFDRKLD